MKIGLLAFLCGTSETEALDALFIGVREDLLPG